MASARATGREQPASLSEAERIAARKREAARSAAGEVRDGMRLGLGTGSTVAYLLQALGERVAELGELRCTATSPATEQAARALGLRVEDLDELGELDLAIDGADQVDRQGWLIKGGGAAHTREKIVASAARRFVVIVSAEKVVERLTAPVPLELVPFAVQTTLRALAPAELRAVPPSPDGGLIADYLGAVADPRELADKLSARPGVVEHGLFAPEMVSEIVIAGAAGVQRREGAKPDAS
ncbi:MAG TPA: ribose-5-phosphate isomerase RpiA [Solirubrobacteraceae bacterium]|jgi:ribose 5-phosphate isomerase A|nr:ribose-5-phosphate isomerase RpiA [Solirubrobacteraceae bacterium]